MVHQHFSLVEPLTVWENVALGDVGQLDPRAGAPTRRRDQRAVRPGDRPRRPHRRSHRRHAPAGRDHQVPAPRPADPRVRRADVGADAGGVGVPVRRVAPRRRGRGQGGGAGQPQAGRGDLGQRRDHDHPRRQGRRLAAHGGHRDPASLARAMVGREVVLRREHAAFGVLDEPDAEPTCGPRHGRVGSPCCASPMPRSPGATGGCCSIGLDLEVHAGEIVGVAGVEGNGQRALGDVLSSLCTLDAGSGRGRRHRGRHRACRGDGRGPASP